MTALVKAAEQEGQLNVITLPSNWANYGNIMKDFTAKYHIKISDAIPEGSSGQEITAVQTEKGQSRAPDVVDVGTPFALEGATRHLWAPYKVQSWATSLLTRRTAMAPGMPTTAATWPSVTTPLR